MQALTRARSRALGAGLALSSSLLAGDASATPLVWGSGSWGDTWQNLVSVPSLSPLALGLLAAALAASVTFVWRRRPAPER